MLISLLRFLFGYVRISIKGEFPERLLNQLSFRGISVWSMQRNGNLLTACIKTSDYLNILKYRGKNRVFTKVLSRHGLPFLARRYRLRVGFMLGVALYFFTLVFLSNFVWNIEIVGNEAIPTEHISSVLEELGVYEGVKIKSIDQRTLPSRLALEIDGISWASINIEGVKVTVNVSESIKTEKPSNEPCNLVAARDGIITKTEVKNGTLCTKVGQTVKKGDLLVSGFTEYKDGSVSMGVSSGEIIAKTERELMVFVPFEQRDTVTCGEAQVKRVLNVFGLKIPLYLGSVKSTCRVEKSTAYYKKNGMYLPIFVTTATFTPISEITVTLTETQALIKAEEELLLAEQNELGKAEIVSKSTQVDVTTDGITITAKYVCRENIAETQFLLIYATE